MEFQRKQYTTQSTNIKELQKRLSVDIILKQNQI